MKHLRALALGLTVLTACATSPSATSPERSPAQLELEQLAEKLAYAGMSVALPPRVCRPDESDVEAGSYDDDIGCAAPDGEHGALRAYARALVHAHLPDAPDARADALVDAYVNGDDTALATLAAAVERDFDAKLASSRAKAPAPKKKPRAAKGASAVEHADGGVTIADAGEASTHAHDRATASGDADAGPGATDAGPAGPTLKDRIVGTWENTDGPVRNIYALCAEGQYALRYEVVDESLSFILKDLPTSSGTWAVIDGDPPKIEFTVDGETSDATLTSIADDALDLSWGDSSSRLTRRSRGASCD